VVVIFVKRKGWGESSSIRLWEREAYVLKGARTSPKGEVRESKYAVELGQTVPARAGDPTADNIGISVLRFSVCHVHSIPISWHCLDE
jgi:hypothetical protein